MQIEQIADRLVKLINSSPRSPRKEEIVAVLTDSAAGGGAEMVMAVSGAFVAVHAGGLQFQGFHVSHPEPTQRNCQLAILEWLKSRILANGQVR